MKRASRRQHHGYGIPGPSTRTILSKAQVPVAPNLIPDMEVNRHPPRPPVSSLTPSPLLLAALLTPLLTATNPHPRIQPLYMPVMPRSLEKCRTPHHNNPSGATLCLLDIPRNRLPWIVH
jgi:hypothetical protein